MPYTVAVEFDGNITIILYLYIPTYWFSQHNMVSSRKVNIVLIDLQRYLRTPDTGSVNLYSIIGFPVIIKNKNKIRTEIILFIREKCVDFIFIYEYYIIIMGKNRFIQFA